MGQKSGREKEPAERERIKRQTIANRRLQHQLQAA
jgi:hypothetical protein